MYLCSVFLNTDYILNFEIYNKNKTTKTMPKKLKYPKTSMSAVVKLEHFYSVMCICDIEKKCVKYFQVQKDRKKVANYQKMEAAVGRMMAEANYELQKLY